MSRHLVNVPLDGMPEPPPLWERPEHGVRMTALGLDRMLQAALPHAGTDLEHMPVLCSLHLDVDAERLTVAATDRFTSCLESRQVAQTCPDFGFLLRVEDARNLRGLLKSALGRVPKQDKDTEPCDLAYEPTTPDGPMLRVMGRDLDVRFTEAVEPLGEVTAVEQFPDVARFVTRVMTEVNDGALMAPLDVHLNPLLLARLSAAQAAGRGHRPFCLRGAQSVDPVTGELLVYPRTVIATPSDLDPGDDDRDLVEHDEDTLTILISPVAPAGTS